LRKHVASSPRSRLRYEPFFVWLQGSSKPPIAEEDKAYLDRKEKELDLEKQLLEASAKVTHQFRVASFGSVP
jgi:hypothetical protein